MDNRDLRRIERGGDTADLLEMRRAVATGDTARVAELRSQGRGACCEFHAGLTTRAAVPHVEYRDPKSLLTDAEQEDLLLQALRSFGEDA